MISLQQTREKMEDVKLVNIVLKGFPSSYEPFVKGIFAYKRLPNFEREWDDCIQEQTQIKSITKKKGGDENLALISQMKKGNGKGFSKGKVKGEDSAF